MASPIVTRETVLDAHKRVVETGALIDSAQALDIVARSLCMTVEAVEEVLFEQQPVESEGGHVD